MNYAAIPESLEKLTTPIIICDERGQVIFKNTAAVKSVRLPRRHTSMLPHLGQTERGELSRLFERRKPSILTVQTGDRNARALVMHYLREGRPCSLWVFVSLLQSGVVSGLFAEQESALCAVGRDICEYVKAIDELSMALPEEQTSAQMERMEKHLRKIVDALTADKRGWVFDLVDVLDMLESAIERPIHKFGYHISYTCDFQLKPVWAGGKGDLRVLIELHSFYTLYLHLLLFACDAAPLKHIDVAIRREGVGTIDDEYFMDVAFTLPYPPFYTDGDTNDLSALIALSPKNRFEIMMFEAYSSSRGFEMSYRITQERDNNMRIRMKLPVIQKVRLRSGNESDSELQFVRHDLALYFWHIVTERLSGMNSEY